MRAIAKVESAAFRAESKVANAELRAEPAALRSDGREFGSRIEAKIEGFKAEIMNRVIGMILGALVVNIVVDVGAVFGVAKLLGH